MKGIRITERTRNQIQTQGGGEIAPEVNKPELSFLYATRRYVLFYISTKKNIKIIKRVLELQSRHEIKFKHKKGR